MFKRQRVKIVAAVLIALMVLPSSGFSMVAGAIVVGGGTCAVSTVGGPIATSMGLQMAEQKIIQQINGQIKMSAKMLENRIKNDDKAILDQLKRNAAAEKELFKRLAQQMRDITVEAGAAEQKMRAEELYGDGWKIDSTCSDPESGAGIQVGKKAEKQVSTEAYTLLKEHNNKGYHSAGPGSFISKLQAKNSEEITAEVIFPQKGTLDTLEVAQAKEMAEIITNPLPSPQVPERLKGTSEAKAYEAYAKLKEARLAVPQKVFSDNLATHSPTIPLGDWARETYERMGGEGEPEGVVDGKMSPQSLLNMMTNMRFANPNWHANLARANEKWLLYEIASMNAARMEMERRQMVLLQQIAMLLAQDQAARTGQEIDGALRNQHEKMFQGKD